MMRCSPGSLRLKNNLINVQEGRTGDYRVATTKDGGGVDDTDYGGRDLMLTAETRRR